MELTEFLISFTYEVIYLVQLFLKYRHFIMRLNAVAI